MTSTSNKPKGIIIHCAATPTGMDIGFKEINIWHLKRGWDGCGYHRIIRIDASVETGRLVQPFQTGAHCLGKNDHIGICWVGGKEAHDRINEEQSLALLKVCADFVSKFGFTTDDIHGHSAFANKDCPRINMDRFRTTLFAGIAEGIY